MFAERGCLFNSIVFLVCVFVPLVGHIILTVMVLEDDHEPLAALAWLLLIWLLPIVGPLIYLLFGQRRSHVYFGRGTGSGGETPPRSKPSYQYHP